jgi:hypothetical protein
LLIDYLKLDDPCNCDDPLNFKLNDEYYFHDILVIENFNFGFDYTIDNFADWYAADDSSQVIAISGTD